MNRQVLPLVKREYPCLLARLHILLVATGAVVAIRDYPLHTRRNEHEFRNGVQPPGI
jgi:hypothetical protein